MSTNGSTPSPPKEGVAFSDLPWNLNLPNDHVYVHLTTTGDEWTKEHYDPATDTGSLFDCVYSYSEKSLPVFPAMTSLNYGTTIWEGLKCYRDADGKPIVFRPNRNYKRFCYGASQLCLPAPSYELFMRCIQVVIQKNSHLIPPHGDGMKLYVRPMLLGSGQQLGLYPSKEFSLVFYVSPTGNYFKSATSGLNIHIETRRSRASKGGMGNVKCCGNYALALKPLMDAKPFGFHDNIFLELDTYNDGDIKKAIIQEMSAANMFLVLKTGEIVTPSLDRGTILPGVTRESVLALVEEYADDIKAAMGGGDDLNIKATSRDVTVEEFFNASECFCTGTAAEVVPIARVATCEKDDCKEPIDIKFPHGEALPGGPVTVLLLKYLREVMVGTRKAKATENWLFDPYLKPEEFCSSSRNIE